MAPLQVRSHGPAVRALQRRLNAVLVPRPHLLVDGEFGPSTLRAVLDFQRSRRLKTDGVVGSRTQAALGLLPTHNAHSVPGAPVRPSPAPLPAATLVAAGGAPWMAIAEAEKGTKEDGKPGQHNPRIVEYHQATSLKAQTDEVPWCSSFVNWVMLKAGKTGTRSAAAASWQTWGVGLDEGKRGAVVVIKKKTAGMTQATGSPSGFHVAFFLSQTSTHIELLGGNQGDEVKPSKFKLSAYTVKAYRWPK